MNIEINFYEEKKTAVLVRSFDDLLKRISSLYDLDPIDVSELIIKYNDEGDLLSL